MIKKTISVILIFIILTACTSRENRQDGIVKIEDPTLQDSLFRCLETLAAPAISPVNRRDSLAFLVLPIEASCPSCREKVIDSIIQHKNRLKHNHFIIISANGGRRIINSYFKDQEEELPTIEKQLFLDSVNQARNYELYEGNPAFYYTHNGLVYKKIDAAPSTVKQDLQEFFSGFRNQD